MHIEKIKSENTKNLNLNDKSNIVTQDIMENKNIFDENSNKIVFNANEIPNLSNIESVSKSEELNKSFQ